MNLQLLSESIDSYNYVYHSQAVKTKPSLAYLRRSMQILGYLVWLGTIYST